mmetsp:Transcript_35043/g.78971  ORF Transcript_35043/g.78971 Transcript_35043/m.78971 type:complete len:413 (-) Transcript_35043:7-1245(-)
MPLSLGLGVGAKRKRVRHRQWLTLCIGIVSFLTILRRQAWTFSLHPTTTLELGHRGATNVFGLQQRATAMLASVPKALSRGCRMAAATATSTQLERTDERLTLLPDPALAAKVCATATMPYVLRCIVDLVRGVSISSPTAWQLAFAGMWALNTVAIAVPGRFDGRSKTTLDDGSAVLRFFTPAGWAFAIWGPIFLGEFLAMSYLTACSVPALQGPLGDTPMFGKWGILPTMELGSLVAPGWCAAIMAQVAWCATFRPQIGVANLWIPTSCLGATAVLLGRVHRDLCKLAMTGRLSILANAIVRIPIALHFGWITCATLVNMNKWLSLNGSSRRIKVAAAYSSVALATVIAAYVSNTTCDPIIAFVVCWSLSAVFVESERDGTPGHLRVATQIGAGASFVMMCACVVARCLSV